ncbi:hypothetical protein LguiB_021902 [Lonicera macranthoides]
MVGPEFKAAKQLIQLCDQTNSKAMVLEEEKKQKEGSISGVSTMKEGMKKNVAWKVKRKYRSLADIMKKNVVRKTKRKYRSLADIYRTTKALDSSVDDLKGKKD